MRGGGLRRRPELAVQRLEQGVLAAIPGVGVISPELPI